ncbi:hypothetical protein OZX60_03695 [Streptococcaceae bacterium ESL0687]|nr:hypothetical protein OZX60_03695 [Streptococcaceae bacterium ESL0687]
MKKSIIAYWNLRKNLITGISLLILALGFIGLIRDQTNWKNSKEALEEFMVDNHYSKEDYQEFRGEIEELIKSGKGSDSFYTIPRLAEREFSTSTYEEETPNYLQFLASLWTRNGLLHGDEAESVINLLPESYEDYKKELNQFYLKDTDFSLTKNAKSLYYSYNNINNLALIPFSLLVAPALLILVSLDQTKNLGLFFLQRGRNRNKLVFGQLVFFVGLPLLLIGLISILTHLTRGLLIPKEYVTLPVESLWLLSGSYIFMTLIACIYILFIDALVGRPIYKFLTAILGLPALLIIFESYDGSRQFLSRYILNVDLKTSFLNLGLAFLIAALIFSPLIYLMNKEYSLEQDREYVRLDFLRLPFYLLILALVVADLLYPLYINKFWYELGFVVILFAFSILIIFAFLIFRPNFKYGKILKK